MALGGRAGGVLPGGVACGGGGWWLGAGSVHWSWPGVSGRVGRREAGFVAGDELDHWLLALFCGKVTPADGADALGIEPGLMGVWIYRWKLESQWRGLVVREQRGRYRLTPAGKRRAADKAFAV